MCVGEINSLLGRRLRLPPGDSEFASWGGFHTVAVPHLGTVNDSVLSSEVSTQRETATNSGVSSICWQSWHQGAEIMSSRQICRSTSGQLEQPKVVACATQRQAGLPQHKALVAWPNINLPYKVQPLPPRISPKRSRDVITVYGRQTKFCLSPRR